MSLKFEVSEVSEQGGRRAQLTLPHGVVQTPVFMPVGTAATVKAVPQDVLEKIGPEVQGTDGSQQGTANSQQPTGNRRQGTGWEWGADYSGEYLSSVFAARA